MKQQARATDKLRRPWAVWLALCIALAGALAPTLSHAIYAARGQDSQMVEICTTSGPRWMALGPVADFSEVADAGKQHATDSTTPALPSVLEHCPFCLLSFDRSAALPQDYSYHFVEPGSVPTPTAWLTFVVITGFAPSPPPRGPPADF